MEDGDGVAGWSFLPRWDEMNIHVRRFILGFLVVLALAVLVGIVAVISAGGYAVKISVTVVCCVVMVYLLGSIIDDLMS